MNDTTCYFLAGVSGWLGHIVIGHTVNYDGTTENFVHNKPFSVENGEGVTFISKESRHISCMHWVRLAAGIKVVAGFIKRRSTVSVFMDMHTIKSTEIRVGRKRQIANFNFYQSSTYRKLIKISSTADVWIVIATTYICIGVRVSVSQYF